MIRSRQLLCLAVAVLFGMGAGAADAAQGVGSPSKVAVTITKTGCRAAPARIRAGAVQFTISNRSLISQRFAIGTKTSARIRPGATALYPVTLDEPSVYSYRCIPNKGVTRRGSLRVAHNLIIETDMDFSDAMAIPYLMARADVEIAAIVVDGTGEARCPKGATNALTLAALVGRPNTPVGCGRPAPLQGTHAFPTVWRDLVDNLFVRIPVEAGPARSPAGSGDEVFRQAIASAPGRVDVLTLGPATELGGLLSTDPQLGGRIRSVTMMGGAVSVPGNITWPPGVGNPYAEWNFYVDPHAANVVFRSGVAVTLVPLDATNALPLNSAVAARLGQSPSATFVRKVIESLLPSTTLYFWDPLAAVAVVEPGISTYVEKRLAVVEGDGPQSGRVIETGDGGQVRVAVTADRSRFEESFASTLR